MQSSQISPQAAAVELLNRRQSRQSLSKFIDYMQLGVVPAAHHRLLIDHLEAVERREILKLMVWMPPGSAKSTYTSVFFPPWFMGRNPENTLLGISNTTDLAERFSRRARNIVASPRFKNVFGFGCSEDSSAAGSWENQKGGEFFAAGVGTSIVGRRSDCGLIDDPIKSREEADSERTREKQWEWYLNDFWTRLKPGARQIVIQTRWHEDDLSGRILNREASEWTVLKLPMLAIDDDPLGRQLGERLWSDWFTEEMVKTAQMDVRAWNSLYQQDPAPDDGDYFKREMFQSYSEIPPLLHIYGASDYAVTEGGGDYTEHGIFGLDHQGDIYILDWWRQQAASNVWIERQCDLISQHTPLIWFGESGPIRRSIEPFLKKRMVERQAPCRLEWLPSIADKVVRARSFQARAAMGNVHLPAHAPWLPELMSQLMRFPAGKYDDGVDVCSLIGRGLEHTRPPEIKPVKKPESRTYTRSQNDGLSWMG